MSAFYGKKFVSFACSCLAFGPFFFCGEIKSWGVGVGKRLFAQNTRSLPSMKSRIVSKNDEAHYSESRKSRPCKGHA